MNIKLHHFLFHKLFYFHHFSHVASNYNFKLFIFWPPAIKAALFLLKHNRNWSDVVSLTKRKAFIELPPLSSVCGTKESWA